MKQYIDLVRDVLENGVWKEPAREGMPRTKEVFCRTMRFNLSEGFPLLTTKKMFHKGIVAELLWFLRGDTNIQYLINNGVHIWDDDAYKFYKHHLDYTLPMSKEDWLGAVKRSGGSSMQMGDCGSIYGAQWRNWEGYFDQISVLVNSLKKRPNSRYHIVTAWNPATFLEGDDAALPACHMMFQCCVHEGKLDLMMLQRSCDLFLGVPFNIASYALLTHLLAKEVGLEPGEFIWVGNSVHLYENHIEQAKEIITRLPKKLCSVKIAPNKSVLAYEHNKNCYEIGDIEFLNYESHPAIKAPLSVGV